MSYEKVKRIAVPFAITPSVPIPWRWRHMSVMAFQIINNWTVCLCEHKESINAHVTGLLFEESTGTVDSPQKGLVTRKKLPSRDIPMRHQGGNPTCAEITLGNIIHVYIYAFSSVLTKTGSWMPCPLGPTYLTRPIQWLPKNRWYKEPRHQQQLFWPALCGLFRRRHYK